MTEKKRRNQRIIARVLKGESLTKVAKRFGITKQRVEQIARGLHVQKQDRDKDFIKSHKKSLLRDRRSGHTLKEIMEKYKLCSGALYTLKMLFKEHGLNKRISRFGKIGQKFGDWEIIDNKRKGDSNEFVACRCRCGKAKLVRVNNILAGESNRCHSCAAKFWRSEKRKKKKKSRFKIKPTGRIIDMATKSELGNSIRFVSFPNKVVGWTTPLPVVGDEIRAEMRSGKVARFLICNMKIPGDPEDMFFATVRAIGYVE